MADTGAETGGDGFAPLRVMSFNVRYNTRRDGENAWTIRKSDVGAYLLLQSPDILLLQEVLADMKDDVDGFLGSAYRSFGQGRDDGERAGEMCPIWWRADRFTEEESGTFWLSEDPLVTGSKHPDAACIRICTWVALTDNVSKQTILAANLHADHISASAKLDGVTLVAERLASHTPCDTIFVGGDFNSTPDSEPYKRLLESDFEDVRFSESTTLLGPDVTCQGFYNGDSIVIDHIFLRLGSKATPRAFAVLSDVRHVRRIADGKHAELSDHRPIIALLHLDLVD